MNRTQRIVSLTGTAIAVLLMGYNSYTLYEKKLAPPGITYASLKQNPTGYQDTLSPTELVTYVDTATSNLSTTSNPASEVNNLEKLGYLTLNCAQEYNKGNGWTPTNIEKYHFSSAKIDKLQVLHSAPATSDPNIWVVQTSEVDEYQFSNGRKPSYVQQSIQWFLLKNSQKDQWQINKFQVTKSTRIKSWRALL